MPRRLALHLPFLTDEQRAELFGSIYSAAAFPRGNPIREGVIDGNYSLLPLYPSHSPFYRQLMTTS